MAHRSFLHTFGSGLLAAAVAFSLAGGLLQPAQAAAASIPTAYYVSLAGSDANPGTVAAPFRTFAKGTSVLMPGDSLFINGGTYNEQLSVSRSGASGTPITIAPVPGAQVVIDLLNQKDDNVLIAGSYVTVRGLELRNSSGFCADLEGTHNTLQGSLVHDCYDMGIFTDGQDQKIVGNTVYHASLKNRSFNMSGGWASGIKVRVGGNRILIANNRTYNNYGEGIAVTRGAGVTILNNISHDNYSDNIYIDNSYNVLVARNFAFNHPNNGFGTNGVGADNISIGEEYYAGWGAKLSNIRVVNNVTFNGSHGILFSGNSSGTPGGGLKNSLIAFNTVWGSVNSEIYIVYDTGQSGNLVANNIVQQTAGKLVLLQNPSGIAFSHNFWVNSLPPSYARAAGDRTGDVKLASAPGYLAASFRLSSASSAVNAGSLVAGVADDYAGGLRPTGVANDMGAFEYGSSGVTTLGTSGGLKIDPSSLAFGNQLAGTLSAAQPVTLTNSTTHAVSISSISTGSGFVLGDSGTCPLAGGALDAGGSCTMQVAFAPVAASAFAGAVTVASDLSDSPAKIGLSGNGVAGTPLIKDPSFELDADANGKPDGWAFANFDASADGRDCSLFVSGHCSLGLAGNATSKAATQAFTVSGSAGDDFTFALFSRSEGLPGGSLYRLTVQLFNGTAPVGTRVLSFNAGTHGFQKVSGTITAAAPYTGVVFNIVLNAASGTAWFDAARLDRAP